MTEPVLRRATPDDADAAVILRALMFRSMGLDSADHPGWQRAARAWFRHELSSARVCMVLAEIDDEVVSGSMGSLRRETPSPSCPNGEYGLLSNVATLPQFRGRGLARACTEGVMAWFRDDTDAGQVDLYATGEGREMYERIGFRVATWPAMRLRIERLRRPAQSDPFSPA